MKKQEIVVDVFAFYRDHGDGGGSCSLYRNKEHYIEKTTAYYRGKPNYQEEVEEAEASWEAALTCECPYDDGEIKQESIKLEFVDDKWQIVEEVCFSWGQ